MRLHGKKVPTTTHSRLYFIGYQDRPVLARFAAQRLDKFGGKVIRARYALYRFENYSGNTVVDHRLCRGNIIAWNKVRLKWFTWEAIPFVGVPGDRRGRCGSAMEALSNGKDLLPTGRLQRHA